MAFTLSATVIGALNAQQQRDSDLRFARDIRAFRPDPVRHVSDPELAEIVRLSREAARGFGLRDDRLVARFVMVDALIAPGWHRDPQVVAHFRDASGSPEAKAGDLFQLIRISLRQYGREAEVWW